MNGHCVDVFFYQSPFTATPQRLRTDSNGPNWFVRKCKIQSVVKFKHGIFGQSYGIGGRCV